jgi:hypothetical protein
MDNPIEINQLRSEQARQLVDCRQIFDALRAAEVEAAHRFAGSMAWKRVKGRDYLYRRRGAVEHSLGQRSAETEAVAAAFHAGKAALEDQVAGLRDRLERMAPVNVALGLARVPDVVARILRRLDVVGMLGARAIVVGTNALFAYEASAGCQFQSGLLATGDVDIELDARRRLGLVADLPSASLIALLRQVDPSFRARRDGDFRAVNRDGFMVDLITPAPRDALRNRPIQRIGAVSEDLGAAEVEKLQWIVEAPRFEATAIGQNGLPLRLVAADPRFFAAHKLWLAERNGRDPLKRGRDRQQALAVAALLAAPLRSLSLGDDALSQIPGDLRDRLRSAVAAAGSGPRPAW